MGKVGGIIAGAVLVGIAIAIPGAIAASPIAMSLFGTGASLALGGAAQLLKQAPSQSLGASQTGIQANIASTTAALPVVYGQARLGLVLADMRQDPTNPNKLYIVGALCHGSADGSGIEQIGAIYFDGDPTPAVNAAGTVATKYASAVVVRKYLGSSSQTVDTVLNTVFPAAWPTTSKGAGVAYVVVELTYDPLVFPGAIPNITVDVRGGKLYDPRTATSSYTGGKANPMLAQYDYLTAPIYGLTAPAAELNSTWFQSMANHCDELVPWDSGTFPRFRCAGWIDTAVDIRANVGAINASCRGNLVYEGGMFRPFIRRTVTPSPYVLSEANIVGDWDFSTPGVVDKANLVTLSYLDPTQNWQAIPRPWPRAGASNAYLTADNNYPNPKTGELQLVIDPYTVEQIAMVLLKESRASVACALTAFESALVLQLGDVVSVTHGTPNWSAKLFWVMGLALLADSTVRLILLEYDGTAYSLDTQTTLPGGIAAVLPTAASDEAQKVAGTILTPGTITSGSGQTDGVNQRAMMKGYQSGYARHGDTITFSPIYQNTPQTKVSGGPSAEPGNKWNASGDGTGTGAPTTARQTPQPRFSGLTASTGVIDARIRQKGTLTAVTANFPSGNDLSTAGDTTQVALSSAPDASDSYRVRATVKISGTTTGSGSASVVVAIDTSPTTTSPTWTQRATSTFSTAAGTGVLSGTLDKTITVSGLTGTALVRIRIVSVTYTGTGIGSASADVKGWGATGEPTPGVAYSTSSTDQYASLTPDAGDTVFWESWATT